MSRSHDPIAVTTAVAYNFDVHSVQGDIHSNLLIWPENRKRCYAIAEGNKPSLGKSRSHRYHVLLADAHVHEAFLQRCLHVLKRSKTKIAGEEDEPTLLSAKVLDPA